MKRQLRHAHTAASGCTCNHGALQHLTGNVAQNVKLPSLLVSGIALLGDDECQEWCVRASGAWCTSAWMRGR